MPSWPGQANDDVCAYQSAAAFNFFETMMFVMMDRYTFNARVAPVVIIVLALPLAVSAWIPFSEWPTKLVGFSTVLVVGAYAASFLARDAGKALQGLLWTSWGGPPTVQLLRHSDRTLHAQTKAHLHKHIVSLGIVNELPSAIDEADNPTAADEKYLTCSDWLRRKALELKANAPFDVVHSENIGYGFRRNLLGIRKFGLVLDAFSFLIASTAFYFGNHPFIEVALIFIIGAFLLLGINEGAVKRSAFDYSHRLLDAVFSLKPETPKLAMTRKVSKGGDL